MWAMVCTMMLLSVTGPLVTRAQSLPTASLEPARGPVGTTVTIRGAGWPAGRAVTVSMGRGDRSLATWLDPWVRGRVNYDGTLVLTAVVPRQYTSLSASDVTVTPGDYSVVIATDPGTDGSSTSVGELFTVTVESPAPGPLTIGRRFQEYYYTHDGGRLLGSPISEVRFEGQWRAQYFEKGRLEDHTGDEGATGDWRFIYGRLAADLAARGPTIPVGGDTSSVTYATLRELATPENRMAVPAGWTGVQDPGNGQPVFVPIDANLRPAPGHYVPARFWAYINQPALFPAGWLHDIGLPLTKPTEATVTKTVNGTRVERTIILQLFERTVLTDDPANPAGFHIERANTGLDYLRTVSGPVIPGDVVLHAAFQWIGPTATDEDIPAGMIAPVWQWRSRFNTTINMDNEVEALKQELVADGWTVQPGSGGGFAVGELVALKGHRQQIIAWWKGTRPGLPPDQPELGTQMRVVVGDRQ
jgi:hypothetical protein